MVRGAVCLCRRRVREAAYRQSPGTAPGTQCRGEDHVILRMGGNARNLRSHRQHHSLGLQSGQRRGNVGPGEATPEVRVGEGADQLGQERLGNNQRECLERQRRSSSPGVLSGLAMPTIPEARTFVSNTATIMPSGAVPRRLSVLRR